MRVGSRGARHRFRCSRAHGFRHREPASSASSPTERARLRVRARGLDPWPRGLDRALLVDFCNHNNPRARPRDRLSPASQRKDRNPCVRHGQRRLAVRYGSEAQPLRHRRRRSRFHGSGGRRRLSQPVPPCLADALAGVLETGVTPTRSARTPLVVRPLHRRLELRRCERPLPSGRGTRDDPTTRAPPPRRVGARGPSDPLAQGHRCEGVALADDSGAQGSVTRSSAKKSGIGHARGAFHRRAGHRLRRDRSRIYQRSGRTEARSETRIIHRLLPICG
jgi:hypothetical protein